MMIGARNLLKKSNKLEGCHYYGADGVYNISEDEIDAKRLVKIQSAAGSNAAKAIYYEVYTDNLVASEIGTKLTVSMNVYSRQSLSKCFDYALEDDNGYITFNPCRNVTIPKPTSAPQTKTRYEPHVYIPSNMIDSIFNRFPIGQPTHIPLLLGFRCGLRLGEAYGCVWEDIDFEKKTLSVNRQVQWVSSKKIGRGGNRRNDVEYGFWYFSEPKYRSYRNIDLDDDLISILMNEKEKQEISEKYYGELGYFTRYYADEMIIHDGVVPDYYPSPINKIGTDETDYPINFVCRRENGTYISPRTMQHTSSVIHNQLQFEAFDYHSLRHTHTTMLIENGAPPIYVQKRLGHKNLDTTLNIYANHLTEKFKEQGNMVLNNIF